MADYLTITGGNRLEGTVRVSGAKNSVLPLIISTLLSGEECRINNVPDIEDISILLRLLQGIGSESSFSNNTLYIKTPEIRSSTAPYAAVKAIRASFWVLGPLLARSGFARVALPGGDAIGARPVDLHLKGLAKMGAEIRMKHGVVEAEAPGKLKPCTYALDFPSVGATHQMMMTASLVEGETILEGVAKEPEVVELANFISSMGATIEGAGTETIRIVGCSELKGATTSVLGDRIEAATYLVAGAMTGGKVTVTGISPVAVQSSMDLLEEAGATLVSSDDTITITGPDRLKAVSFNTAPYPGVATDVQPQFMAAMSVAKGKSIIHETVFENRFGHVPEYRRFGASISIDGRVATIEGVDRLSGAPVEGRDIRAAAGMVLMSMCAEGKSEIYDIHHLDRGYERLVDKCKSLGVDVVRSPSYDKCELIVGC